MYEDPRSETVEKYCIPCASFCKVQDSPAIDLIFWTRPRHPSLAQRSRTLLIARNDPVAVAGGLLESELDKQGGHCGNVQEYQCVVPKQQRVTAAAWLEHHVIKLKLCYSSTCFSDTAEQLEPPVGTKLADQMKKSHKLRFTKQDPSVGPSPSSCSMVGGQLCYSSQPPRYDPSYPALTHDNRVKNFLPTYIPLTNRAGVLKSFFCN